MSTYLVLQTDEVTRIVDGVDAYAPEGSLTTFFATRDGRGVIDSWAARIASFRTAGIASIERVDVTDAPEGAHDAFQGTYEPVNANVQRAMVSAPPMAYIAGSTRSLPSNTTASPIASGNALIA